MRILSSLFLSCLLIFSITAQELRPPLNIPLQLSGNFGELRPNHFHSGIDFKTGGTVGKSVVAVEDGYVSRVAINTGGYGKALYIDHPSLGYTTVYGHLDGFSPAIEAYVYQKQMEQQAYIIDIKVPADSLPVQRGKEVALSGNTGSSGGPHLHFEVRETESEKPIDPLPFYKQKLKDTSKPEMESIAVVPAKGLGVVEGKTEKSVYSTKQSTAGTYQADTVTAWGKVGIALKCHDRMDGVRNVFGVKDIRLTVDSELIFSSSLTKFAFDETRYINSFIDYEAWKNKEGFFQKCYTEPGNRLPFISTINQGMVNIDSERDYHVQTELEDEYGNQSTLSFVITGKRQKIDNNEEPCENLFSWRAPNRFRGKGIDLELPRGAIYNSFCFNYSVGATDSAALAATHRLHNDNTPLHTYCRLAIFLNSDPVADKSKYGIERVTPKGNVWIGGSYRNGWVEGRIREFGTYTAGVDTIAPKITPSGTPQQWVQKRQIELRLTDDKSGIDSFKTYIDGEFVLFDIDRKSVIRTDLSTLPQTKKTRELTIELRDKCGNTTLYKERFEW